MSYTEMFIVNSKGTVIPYAKFHNSHRGAMMIWINMFRKFCRDMVEEQKKIYLPMSDFIMPMSDEHYDAIWALAKNPKIDINYRIVLAATFDHVILEKEHFEDYIKAVEWYAEDFPVGTLLQQIKVISKLSKHKIIGICWNQTSVSSDMWDSGSFRRFNIFKDADRTGKHPWKLFEWLKSLEETKSSE